ncbi:hypothetical protein F5144DRAFT_589433 [Chaetomium tenue]|uniref:Uncharacterized protein n=1 Tax=Chaetomium tenue TaxID=1854479 RepID=A0ACB7PRN5_9PEZI|nr:hypothetical protein F5144DRAFT_589433 [Chaetomium globosum]
MPSKRSKPAHKVTKRAGAIEAPVPSAQPQPTTSDDTSPVYFWRETDPQTGYLSQWYACAFTDDTDPTIVYPTAEHYMMYQKALLFSDPAMASQILQAEHPRQVKALGRQVANFTDQTWNAHREAIVRRGNRLKFTRPANPADGMWRVAPLPGREEAEAEGAVSTTIRELLLRTGEREIVETSPMDRVWGIGFGAARAGSVRGRWGLNLLGKALVAVRDELRKEVEGKGGEGEGKEEGEEKSDGKGEDEGGKEGEKEGVEKGEDKGKDNGEAGGENVGEEVGEVGEGDEQKVKRRKTEKQG